ncbi:MAG: hypothetical protein ACT4P1_12430 [Sporichthyaceae bacterium]
MTSPGGAGEVEVSVDMLADWVKRQLVPMHDQMIAISAAFGAMPNYQALFGPIPAARELDARHRDAYEVYAPTIRALGDDLDLLIGKLRTVIKNYSDEDDNVAMALMRLGEKITGKSGYQSDAVYSQHVRESIQRSVASPAVAAPAGPGPGAAPVPAAPAAPAPAPPAAEPPAPTQERTF